MDIDRATHSTETAEPVHSIWNYYDGPREGIADFRGMPHIYKCQFSEAEDDWTDLFRLTPIDEGLLALAQEQQAIYLRWCAEFDLGRTSIDSHPALPSERTRYNDLQAAFRDRLQPLDAIVRRGRFSSRGSRDCGVVYWSEP